MTDWLSTRAREGGGAAALQDARRLARGVEDPLPGAALLPGGEVVEDGGLGQQVVWQHVPLDAGACLVEDGVDDLPHVHLTRPAARLGGGMRGAMRAHWASVRSVLYASRIAAASLPGQVTILHFP